MWNSFLNQMRSVDPRIQSALQSGRRLEILLDSNCLIQDQPDARHIVNSGIIHPRFTVKVPSALGHELRHIAIPSGVKLKPHYSNHLSRYVRANVKKSIRETILGPVKKMEHAYQAAHFLRERYKFTTYSANKLAAHLLQRKSAAVKNVQKDLDLLLECCLTNTFTTMPCVIVSLDSDLFHFSRIVAGKFKRYIKEYARNEKLNPLVDYFEEIYPSTTLCLTYNPANDTVMQEKITKVGVKYITYLRNIHFDNNPNI